MSCRAALSAKEAATGSKLTSYQGTPPDAASGGSADAASPIASNAAINVDAVVKMPSLRKITRATRRAKSPSQNRHGHVMRPKSAEVPNGFWIGVKMNVHEEGRILPSTLLLPPCQERRKQAESHRAAVVAMPANHHLVTTQCHLALKIRP